MLVIHSLKWHYDYLLLKDSYLLCYKLLQSNEYCYDPYTYMYLTQRHSPIRLMSNVLAQLQLANKFQYTVWACGSQSLTHVQFPRSHCLCIHCTVDAFSSNYKLTIGVDFSLKKIKWTERMIFHLQLWYVSRPPHHNSYHITIFKTLGCIAS